MKQHSCFLLIFGVLAAGTARGQAPVISSGGMVGSASLQGGPLAAGMLATIFGSNLSSASQQVSDYPIPVTLGPDKTQVSFGGYTAPLFYVSPGQINLQIPWEVSGDQVLVQVQTIRGSSNIAKLAVVAAAPEIFAVARDGVAIGAVTSTDGKLVDSSAPAYPGNDVSIWCNGLGPLLSPVRTGYAADGPDPLKGTAQIMIGGGTEPATYAGAAPGASGLNQANLKIPKYLLDGRNRLAIRILGDNRSYDALNWVNLSIRNDPSHYTLVNASYQGTYLSGEGTTATAILENIVTQNDQLAGLLTLVDDKRGTVQSFTMRGRLPGDGPAQFDLYTPSDVRPQGVLSLRGSVDSVQASGTIADQTGVVWAKISFTRTF